MKLTYMVHRASIHPMTATVTHMGEEVQAQIPMSEVELTPVSGDGHGSLVLRFQSSSERNESRTLFPEGGLIDVMLTSHSGE